MDHGEILRSAHLLRGDASKRMKLEPAEPGPRWPSGIRRLDFKTDGGFYGFSVLASAPKVGKTVVALRSSVMACIDGWNTVYWAGENAEHLLSKRIEAILGPQKSWPVEMERWCGMRFYPGIHMKDFVAKTAEVTLNSPASNSGHVLIVIDSVNRLAKYISEAQNVSYYRALEGVVRFCQQAAEESGGQIGVLALSELNRQGGAIGLDIEYAAACLLYMKRSPRRARDYVRFTLESRETPGGSLGTYWRDADNCAFIHEEESEGRQLALVTPIGKGA